jgi:signal transduction histidine kinase
MKTILLIDDDAALRRTYSMALSEAGYHVLEADTGSGGLAMARQHLPDLVLSDIHMPGGDGSTLLRDLRQDRELRSKQIVLMTGKPELVTPRKGMEDGADDFLVKPVSLEALLSCVEARFRRASVSWRVEDQMLTQMRSLVPPQLPHELFTPMAGIIGLTEILRSGLPSFTPGEVNEIIDDIHLSSLRLNRTLKNYLLVLDLQTASSEALMGSLSTRQVEESIQNGVNEALRLNKRQDDVTIRVETCSIAVKPGDLSRIAEELVDNAFKYSRQGTPVEVKLDSEGCLTVTDSGRGMTFEQVKNIGVFQQFDRKKYEQQGLGLGLFLVQKLTALYGTKLLISSQLGEGTQAEITFPHAP